MTATESSTANTQTERYTTGDFHRDALEIMDRHQDAVSAQAEIAPLLQRLSLQPDILPSVDLENLHTTGSTATILHQGPEGRAALMLLRLPAAAPTPIHNHNCWGVACVVQGRNRYWRWSRRDDLSDPNRADVYLVEEFDHGPGELAGWGDPPQDLHAQQGIDEAAYEFVFFARNPNLQARAYFNPDTGEVTYASAVEQMPTRC